MSELLHSQILEQKRQKERQQRNLNAKRRLEEIAIGSKTQWSGNLIYDLKSVNEAVKGILDPKLSHQEYMELLSHHDIIPNEVLTSTHYTLIGAIDPYYQRMFNKYIELLLVKKEEAVLKGIERKQNKKSVVQFHEQIKSLTEELQRLLKPRQ